MIIIDKITNKSFRTREEYEQFLKLVRKEKFLCQSCYRYYMRGKEFCPKCGNKFER